MARQNPQTLSDDPFWYKDAVIYEVHVRAFFDSNGDGIGDFRGLTEKLDYLQDLGVTAIWLLPFYPSPLLDDGYDIGDYTAVHSSYGTLRDVRTFIAEAHRRGIRVITELVCNHTSDQHRWFQRARRSRPDSSARNFYVWSNDPEKYRGTRVIFKDFEASNWTWDPVAGAYYWHRFYRHQPDLNFDNPQVRRAILSTMDFWLDMGVDGLRLDAIPYLYEREGTNCENLPETHAFLRELRRHVDEGFPNRMLLAEANQWPEDAVAYFGEGDECHMAYHFPLMPRLFMSVYMEDRYPIIDILRQTPAVPESAQWALFLRNHDELTLEMVTDEERDYMYRVYAVEPQMRINLGIRRRLAPLLGNHRRRFELMKGLLFSLPGTPVIYYGDEIGMGDNIYLGDRNGVRTPMQWSADRNAGFSRANPQKLYLPVIIDPEYHYETVNVEAHQGNPHSLLWWVKRLLALRKRYRAFGRGSLRFLQPTNRKVLAFIREYEDERVLVVANLSRFAQGVELDLSEYRAMVPVEMFGRVEFPPIGDLPYFVTLGPHTFYWFSIEPERARFGLPPRIASPAEVPTVTIVRDWEEVIQENGAGAFARVLAGFLPAQRWFAGKAREVRSVAVTQVLPLRTDAGVYPMPLVEVQYVEGDPEQYFLPLAHAEGDRAERYLRDATDRVIARLRHRDGHDAGVVLDAAADEGFSAGLLAAIAGGRRSRAWSGGDLRAWRTRVLRQILVPGDDMPRASLTRGDQSNTSLNYGDRLLLKLFRKVEPGVNPDLEIGRHLTDIGFENMPRVAGALEYYPMRGEPLTLGVLEEFVRNEGDAWSYTLDNVRAFLERALASQREPADIPSPRIGVLEAAGQDLPELAVEMVGAFVEPARLLGRRTAEMHLALATADGDVAFTPEPFTRFDQRSLYQSLRNSAGRSLGLLRERFKNDPDSLPREAESVLALEDALLGRFQGLLGAQLDAIRMRCHGDYHLGQVLWKGNDFLITDFEGEPARPISERRLKRSPVRDVAGMLRSVSYAVQVAIMEHRRDGASEPVLAALDRWGRFWELWVSASFLRAYLEAASGSVVLPPRRDQLALLLDVHILEKALYEVSYELNNRPDWVSVPLRGVLQLIEAGS